jgi:hypothetical protein
MLLVHDNRNTLSIVLDGDLIGFRINDDIDLVHGRVTLLVVSCKVREERRCEWKGG